MNWQPETSATGTYEMPPKWVFYAALLPVLAAIIGFGGVYSYIWVPVDLVIMLAACALILQTVWQKRPLIWNPLMAPVLGFGLLVFLQWRGRFSVYPGATLTEMIQLAGCGAVFYLGLSAGRDPRNQQRFSLILWWFTGAIVTEALFQFFNANGLIFWFHDASYATPIGPYVYRNHYAGCIDLLLPLVLASAFSRETLADPAWVTWMRRSIVPAMAFASVVLARSKGGVGTLFFEGMLTMVVFWPDIKRRIHARTVVLICVLMLGSFSILANWSPILQRFGTLQQHDPSLIDRLTVSHVCLEIFKDHRWMGTGFNTFATVYPAYQTFDNGRVWLYAHNEYAQMLSETGILGAGCIAAFIGIWLSLFWKCRQRRKGGWNSYSIQLAEFIATAGLMFHSFVDFQFHAPANALLFFLLCGMAAAAVLHERSSFRFDSLPAHEPRRGRAKVSMLTRSSVSDR